MQGVRGLAKSKRPTRRLCEAGVPASPKAPPAGCALDSADEAVEAEALEVAAAMASGERLEGAGDAASLPRGGSKSR